jgi:hypothetical protein
MSVAFVFIPAILIGISEFGAGAHKEGAPNLSLEFTMDRHTILPAGRLPNVKLSIVNRGVAPVFITRPQFHSGHPDCAPQTGVSVIRSNIDDVKKEHPKLPPCRYPCPHGEAAPKPLPLIKIGPGESYNVTAEMPDLWPSRFAIPGRYRLVVYYFNLPANSWFRETEGYRDSTPCRLISNEVELLVVE